MKWLADLLSKLFNVKKDPLYNCELHLHKGCAHVDGFLCDMNTCYERKHHVKNFHKGKKS